MQVLRIHGSKSASLGLLRDGGSRLLRDRSSHLLHLSLLGLHQLLLLSLGLSLGSLGLGLNSLSLLLGSQKLGESLHHSWGGDELLKLLGLCGWGDRRLCLS